MVQTKTFQNFVAFAILRDKLSFTLLPVSHYTYSLQLVASGILRPLSKKRVLSRTIWRGLHDSI